MTLRDRGLIAALSVALVALTIASLAPSLEGTHEVGAQPSRLPLGRPYIEGVLGHATNASPFGARSPADRGRVLAPSAIRRPALYCDLPSTSNH